MGDQMAVGIVIAAGCWLIGLGFLMLFAPGRALAALGAWVVRNPFISAK